MTDNFERYREFIRLMSPEFPQSNKKSLNDKFYVIELMRRGKDNPDMPAANYHFKNYYIFSWDDLRRCESEIKLLCKTLRMRAYCSVNWKSLKAVSLNTSAEFAQRIASGDLKKIWTSWSSQCGLFKKRGENLWVIDVDDTEAGSPRIQKIKDAINKCTTTYQGGLVFEFPSRTGIHLIYRPFRIDQFEKLCQESSVPLSKDDIKKNHLTLLFEDL